MKRWKKIVLAAVLCLLAVIAGLAAWQKENIKALYTSVSKDQQTITQDMEDKRQQQQSSLEEKYQVTVKPPSAQHNNDLLDGKVTPEEVKQELGISEKLEEPTQPPKVDKPAAPEQPEAPAQSAPEEPPKEPELTQEEREKQINDLMDRCVAELYACEVDLMARMGELKKTALKDWNSRPETKWKDGSVLEFGMSWLDECYYLEVEIDRKVDEILERYRPQLEALDADTDVLIELWNYYCDKKTDTKAYYMDKYLG